MITMPKNIKMDEGATEQMGEIRRFLEAVRYGDPDFAADLEATLGRSLETISRCTKNTIGGMAKVWKDWAPLSFVFLCGQGGMNGGIIFHGSHDGFGGGGSPTFSVCVEPTEGWQIHT